MKIKNKLFLVFALCLTVLFAVSLAACNPNGGSDDSNNNPNNYEVSKYTVTFNTNSDMVLANPVIRDIPYGTCISEPTDANGNKIIPVKKGYTFTFWSKDGQNPFDFTQGITANTTLTALYKNNVYYHTPVLTAVLNYDEQTGKFTVNQNGRDENDVTLPASEFDKETTTLKSTYASANDKLPCPTATVTDGGQDNKFCFWYYLNDEGKPIQLSKWRAEGDSTVASLSSYYFTEGLTVYPMFTDNLPLVTVKYVDSLDSDAEPYKVEQYKFGEYIEYTSEDMPTPTDKDGYKFEDWYYVVEGKDSGGNVTFENNTFVFADGVEKSPTSPIDAAGAEDNFTPVELILYARWTREITVKSVEDYKSLYNEFKNLTSIENPSENEQARIDEILTANIVFNGTIDFSNEADTFEPLFDSQHPFKGTIDGLTKIDELTSKNALIKGGVFGDATTASVFGYNEGTIKNIDFENIGLKITNTDSILVYIGVITTDNAGTIENCAVTMDQPIALTDLHTVVFGGVTAVNHGITTRNGLIRLCTVKIGGFSADCEALTFGGIAGESNASASIVNDTVEITVSSIKCTDDGISANGRSYLNFGGIVGISASSVRLCRVDLLRVVEAQSLTEFVFGGIVAVNSGNIQVTRAQDVSLGSKDAPVSVSGSVAFATCIGGMVGKNEGYILNAYAISNLYVTVENAPQTGSNLFIGGIVGSNYSDRKDSNTATTDSGVCAINYSYSLGEIVVTVGDEIDNVNVYAGGIAGRNSHKKLASLFSTVKINIVNNGDNNLGHMFGKMLNDVGTNGKVFYDNDSVITLTKGGKTYEIKGDGEGSEEYVYFENIGDGTDSANFQKASWVVGTTTEASALGFNGTTWEVNEDSYPTFLNSVYDERA